VWGRITVFSRVGETLTRQLRRKSFEASLRMPMSFFDDQKNSIGRLTTRLATDASLVKEATGDSLGSVLEGIGSLVRPRSPLNHFEISHLLSEISHRPEDMDDTERYL
jgi:ABC-type multidrug transport system fused ATPase/permease subunit